jgi:alkylation response protein AidB-like acyl-CoA dehydrogenase
MTETTTTTTVLEMGERRAELALEQSAAKGLFSGNIYAGQMIPYPGIAPEEREVLSMVLESVNRFMTGHQEQFAEWDREGRQPESFIEGLRELGLFGLIIPEVYGGIGLSNAAYARAIEEIASHDTSTALTVGAHSSIGMKGLLLFGDETQKKSYLPRLASGEMIAAFCLTETGSGSDAASIRTRADRNPDGSWTLNGEKIWITNGGIADFFTVFARTEGEAGKISAFIVESDWPGVAIGAKEDKMGIRASSTTTVSFSDVRVPADCLLGEEGKGFKIAMTILNNGRTGLGGGAVGGMKRCIQLATEQAQERKQFGEPIIEYGLIKEKIAQMTVDCFAAESVVWMVADYIDSGCEDYSTEAAISKVFSSEAMGRSAYEAQQIAAGTGYMRELPYEQIVRDARILTIFEGTSEILRLYIALAGLKDAGQHLESIRTAVDDIFNSPIKGFGVLGGYAGRKITQLTTLGRDRIVDGVCKELAPDALIYENYALKLARAAEFLLRRHGRNIIGKQFALKRVADIVIDLFVGLCTLSRASSLAQGSDPSAKHAIEIARIFSQQAKRRMKQNLRRIQRNEDEEAKSLAAHIGELKLYPWDVA